MEEVVIIGGGVAGLSCLNALLDRNISALLLEGSVIGAPKMCGEFIAPAVIPTLENWGVSSIQTIKTANFYSQNKLFNFIFPLAAGGYSRSEIEIQLYKRALKLNGRIKENFKIIKTVPATHTTPYIFTSETGIEIVAKTAIFAAGKYFQPATLTNQKTYAGIKFHLETIIEPESLLMFSLPNAYLGFVPITEAQSNCACLFKIHHDEKIDFESHFYNMVSQHRILQAIFSDKNIQMTNWLEGVAVDFGLKNLPNWPQAYWIGDTLASLHPAIGSGLAHSVSSALLAAEHYSINQSAQYRRLSTKNVKTKLHIGKLMHTLLQYPKLGDFAIPFVQSQKWILNLMLNKIL
ncbi:MAG: FAD-dependent oxidoreductase [Gammaproteobacteria bacterium]|nr:FAD-dependent oxidoreductase [Gammaproteobacteria bacterium]